MIGSNGAREYSDTHVAAVQHYLQAGPYVLSEFSVSAIEAEDAELGACIRAERAARDEKAWQRAVKSLPRVAPAPAPVDTASPVLTDADLEPMIGAFELAWKTGDLGAWTTFVQAHALATVPLCLISLLAVEPIIRVNNRNRERQQQIDALEARLAEIEGRGVSFEGAYQAGKSYRRGAIVIRHNSKFVATVDGATADPAKAASPSQWALWEAR